MTTPSPDPGVFVRRFAWDDWRALWMVRSAQLAEGGIRLDPSDFPARPEPGTGDEYEWDFHHLDHVYLSGAGGFWLAWRDSTPVGYVGAQEVEPGAVELRRMYVASAYRRLGIGAALVRALIVHCRDQAVEVIELWTAASGPGRRLYASVGFREAAGPGPEYRDISAQTRYTPGVDEIRMRLEIPPARE